MSWWKLVYKATPPTLAEGEQHQPLADSAGNLKVTMSDGSAPLPTGKAATDRSGAIASGGNAQNAMAANTARAGWSLVNNSDTLMMVNPAGTASASAGIPVFPDDVVEGNETNAISVFCASTGKAFTAWEY